MELELELELGVGGKQCVYASDYTKESLVFVYTQRLNEGRTSYKSTWTDIYVKMWLCADGVGGGGWEASHCSRGGRSEAALNLT